MKCMDLLIKEDSVPVCWRHAKSQKLSPVTSHLGNIPNPQVACSSFISSAVSLCRYEREKLSQEMK